MTLRQNDPSRVALYGRFETSFEAGASAAPFTPFAVDFTSPGGDVLRRPGFFDGGWTYRVRFMPTEVGRWRYQTRSAEASLDGHIGEFHVQQAACDNRFAQHGPIRVAAAGYHLEHADGTKFFFLGDTVWNGPLLSKKEDWDLFLADRVAKGFTAIQFVMHSPWRTAPTNAEGLTAFSGRESISINPKFYRRIDERMDQIERAGLVSVPVLAWSCLREDPGQYLPEADVQKLVEYQVARYGAHQVIWILAGDGNYEKQTQRWTNIGRAVFNARPHAPVAMHAGGQQWPYGLFRDEKWLDIAGYQSGHGDDAKAMAWTHSGPPSHGWQELSPRVVMNLEPPYESHLAYHSRQPISDRWMRTACYWSLLNAPTAGLTYGAHGVWSWQETEGEPLAHGGTGLAKRWDEAMKLPGSVQMKQLAGLFGSIAWWTLRPAQRLLAEQPGTADPARFIAAAQSADQALTVFYLPAGGPVSARSGALPTQRMAQWFDPVSGRRSTATADGDRYTAPGDQDWVLVIQGA